jgi:hypothetical protein
MGLGIVMANLDRAGGHVLILGVLLGLAAVGGLVYGLVRLMARNRATRPPARSRPDGADGPEPSPSTGPAESAQGPEI